MRVIMLLVFLCIFVGILSPLMVPESSEQVPRGAPLEVSLESEEK